MEKKGICVTCVDDKVCTFSRQLPVWHCQEFTVKEFAKKGYEKSRLKKVKNVSKKSAH